MRFVRAQIAEFKRRSKYFQYRVYTIAAFALVMLLTIVVVKPSKVRNRLDAYVIAATGDFVVGSYILVRNDSRKDWTDVRFIVNGTHEAKLEVLPRGEQATLRLSKFTPLQSAGPLHEADVNELWVECSAGKEHYPVSFGGKK